MLFIPSRERFEGEFDCPGDKSITHRAIMLNGSANGTATVENALLGEDCLSTARCMRALGARVEIEGGRIFVEGTPIFNDGATLDCGNSGTSIRLLTGLIAGRGVNATLCGDESLSVRPMKRVAEPLALLGADVRTTDGHAPVQVYAKKLHGASVSLAVASAQVKSAVLLAGITAEGETTVVEPVRSRDHTERMLQAMGADITVDGTAVTVRKSALRAVDILVPSDISSAAYFMVLGALKGETLCRNVGVNPTRTGILRAFDKLGVDYGFCNKRVSGGEELADIRVKKSALRPITLGKEDNIASMIDELPLIALACAFADGESRITGAKELRVKESDRIKTTAEMINGLGGDCEELEDGLIIRGKGKLSGGTVDSYLDHRIAMSGAVGLLASERGGYLRSPQCCAISFPNFFELLSVKAD